MEKLKSDLFTKMNPFLSILSSALATMGIRCDGFYISFYNSSEEKFYAEKIGEIKEPTAMNHAIYFLNMTMLFEKGRSMLVSNCDQGAILLYDNGACVRGIFSSAVAEAISALWLIVDHYLKNSHSLNPMSEESFWIEVKQTANWVQGINAKDNNYISGIAAQIEEEFNAIQDQSDRIKLALNA